MPHLRVACLSLLLLVGAACSKKNVPTPISGLNGYQDTGVGDSQFSAGFDSWMLQAFPTHSVGRFTFPGEETANILARLELPYGGPGVTQGQTFTQRRDPTKNGIVHIYAGTNDVLRAGRTPQAVFAGVKSLVDHARAIGYQKVTVTTISSLRMANDASTYEDVNTRREAVNSLLRSKTGNAFNVGADCINDIAATAEMGQKNSALSTYWFLSQPGAADLHWSDDGKSIVYDMLSQCENRLIAGETGFTVTTHSQRQSGGRLPK